MTQQTMHPLAEQYLEDVRRATSGIPRAQQSELLEDLRAHLEAGLAIASSEADVRNLLESMGTPDSVAAAVDVVPTAARTVYLPFALGVLGVAAGLYGVNPLVHPVRAVASLVLGLAALLVGVRVVRNERPTASRRTFVVLGAVLGSVTLLAVTISWIALIAVDGGGRALYVGPVTEVAAPNQGVDPVTFQIRAVLEAAPAGTADCSSRAVLATNPATEVSACSSDAKTKYRLAPAVVTGANVTSLIAVAGSAPDQSVVEVTLDPAGAVNLNSLSGELIGQAAPRSQLAIVMFGEVFSAPTVMDRLSLGKMSVQLPIPLSGAQVLVGQMLGAN